MQRHCQGGLEWLTFDLLSNVPGLIHGTFTRKGGVSKGSFESLNFAFDPLENPNDVEANFDLVKQALGIPQILHVYQRHGSRILHVNADTPQFLDGFDGMITDTPSIGLLIKHADCQAAIFYDPIHHALANVHSGWRGSVQNIYAHTIEAMKAKYQTRPEDLLVCLSPSLGPQNAEFIHFRKELPAAFWDYQIKPNYFDFWAISEMQLKACGILHSHIEIAKLCTYSNEEDFFSYRRKPLKGMPGGHGTNGTVAMLIRPPVTFSNTGTDP